MGLPIRAQYPPPGKIAAMPTHKAADVAGTRTGNLGDLPVRSHVAGRDGGNDAMNLVVVRAQDSKCRRILVVLPPVRPRLRRW